jgi:hypothetical protein
MKNLQSWKMRAGSCSFGIAEVDAIGCSFDITLLAGQMALLAQEWYVAEALICLN